jgi:hypothetical protein
VGKISTKNLMPGMVLAADVRDRSGRLLLKADTELSERHLHILRTWGTVDVEIAGMDDNQPTSACANTIDPELWATIEGEVTHLFRHADLTHPAIKELLRIRILQEAGYGNR